MREQFELENEDAQIDFSQEQKEEEDFNVQIELDR